MKICSKCGIEKNEDDFPFIKKTKKHAAECKECRSIYQKKYREKNKEKKQKYDKKYYKNNKEKIKKNAKKYRDNNKEKLSEYHKHYRKKHRDKKIKYAKEYYEENKEELLEKSKIYIEDNKEKVAETKQKYYKKNFKKFQQYKKEYYEENKNDIRKKQLKREKERYHNDINFKLASNMRSRIRTALKKFKKSKKTMELVGCTLQELKQHLESQFKDGMTWENHGNYGWHIDHIIPCASFDLSIPEEQQKCFHYTNLQPLWAEENLKKSDKIIEEI